MADLIYALAAFGFVNAGWSFWRALMWPYYAASAIAELTTQTGGSAE